MKISSKAKSLLGSIAPLIGGAIGGPYGAAAVSFLKQALSTDDEAEIESQLASASPETLLRLKQANKDWEVKMRELGIREDQLFLEDRQSAREFGVKTGIGPQIALAGLFIGGYFLILITMLSGMISPALELKDMTLILIGVLAGEIPRIMSFFFGSTKGSSDKNAYMAAAMKASK